MSVYAEHKHYTFVVLGHPYTLYRHDGVWRLRFYEFGNSTNISTFIRHDLSGHWVMARSISGVQSMGNSGHDLDAIDAFLKEHGVPDE